jgi:hypothetical protein
LSTVTPMQVHYKEVWPSTLPAGGEGAKLGILLVHGFGAGVFAWRHVMEPLALQCHCRVVAFDRPAFGASCMCVCKYILSYKTSASMIQLEALVPQVRAKAANQGIASPSHEAPCACGCARALALAVRQEIEEPWSLSILVMRGSLPSCGCLIVRRFTLSTYQAQPQMILDSYMPMQILSILPHL